MINRLKIITLQVLTSGVMMLLKNEADAPSDFLLDEVLSKDLYCLYGKIIELAKVKEGLDPQWRYYKDGGAWLCKVVNGKKTIFWLSLWSDCIKVSFYFTEKNSVAVRDLEITDEVKNRFFKEAYIGKLIPLIMELSSLEHLHNLEVLIQYKKGLK